jgi:hypothetical protein
MTHKTMLVVAAALIALIAGRAPAAVMLIDFSFMPDYSRSIVDGNPIPGPGVTYVIEEITYYGDGENLATALTITDEYWGATFEMRADPGFVFDALTIDAAATSNFVRNPDYPPTDPDGLWLKYSPDEFMAVPLSAIRILGIGLDGATREIIVDVPRAPSSLDLGLESLVLLSITPANDLIYAQARQPDLCGPGYPSGPEPVNWYEPSVPGSVFCDLPLIESRFFEASFDNLLIDLRPDVVPIPLPAPLLPFAAALAVVALAFGRARRSGRCPS